MQQNNISRNKINLKHNNKVGLTSEQIEKVNNILSFYFSKVEESLENKNIQSNDIPKVILSYISVKNYYNDNLRWEEVVRELLKSLIKDIENKFYSRNLSIFNGISLVDYALRELSNKVDELSNLYNQIHNIFVIESDNFLNYCLANIENIEFSMYDLVFGASGIGLNILLKKNIDNEDLDILRKILLYFNVLSYQKYYNENEMIIPRWHIKNENQFRNDEKEIFKLGNLNYGLAHGIVGPLLIMSECYSKNITDNCLEEAILYNCKLYKNNCFKENKIYHWPTQQDILDYKKGIKKDQYRNKKSSWCYGNAGIASALLRIGRNLKDDELMKIAIETLKGISCQDLEKDNLNNVIVCHGYAGLLIILKEFENKINDKKYNRKSIILFNKILESFSDNYKYGFLSKDEILMDNLWVPIYIENLDILEGATGIILALIDYCCDSKILSNLLLVW